MIEFFGKDKLLTEITGDDVARLVAWRRGHRGKSPGSLLTPHTVNHMLETLRSLFSRAKLWGVRFNHEPIWHKLMLPIPSERVRELSDDEAARLEAVARGDYGTFIAFARASGLRLRECLLKWSEIDLTGRPSFSWPQPPLRSPPELRRARRPPSASVLQSSHSLPGCLCLCETAEP
jgi:hypothetical protein